MIFGRHELPGQVECLANGRQETKVHWRNEVQELCKVDGPNVFAMLMNLHLQMTPLLDADFNTNKRQFSDISYKGLLSLH